MRKVIAALFAGALLFTAACSDDYGRDDAISDLQEGGLSEEVATCVADEMEAQDIDFKEANESDTDSEVFSQVVEITTDCLSGGWATDDPAADDTEDTGTDTDESDDS